MTLAAGETLGPYRIVERIGQGGMASVHKAYQPSLGRHVAIKVLPAFFAEDPGFRERFRQEALAVAQLRHPNILAIFDYGEEKGSHYIVGEYVSGGALADQLGSPMSVARALAVLRPIAAALDHAHQRGMVHRDVKPSNVLIATDGTPILADFGLAHMVGTLPRLTQTGTAIGTPEYMSPEVAEGFPAGPASDQYALGVIAYEMLTGRVPFTADTPLAVLLAHAHAPLPLPRSIEPSIPPAVEDVLLKVLAKIPADRFADCSQFVAALERAAPRTATRLVEAPGATSRPVRAPGSARSAPPSRRGRWLLPATAAILAVVAATFVAAVVLTAPTPASSARTGTAMPKAKLLYQAKLDAAGTDIARSHVDGDPAFQQVRTSAGAIALSARSPGGLDVVLVYSPPARYAAETALALNEGILGFGFQWRVAVGPTSEVIVLVTPGSETMRVRYMAGTDPAALQQQDLTPEIAVRGMQAGRVFTVGVVIDAPRFALFLDGVEVASGSDDRLGRDAAPVLFRACCGQPGSAGTMTIRDVRFYALP